MGILSSALNVVEGPSQHPCTIKYTSTIGNLGIEVRKKGSGLEVRSLGARGRAVGRDEISQSWRRIIRCDRRLQSSASLNSVPTMSGCVRNCFILCA